MTYVVDAAQSRSNLEKIIALAQRSDLLYIEAAFLSGDVSLAKRRKHLTAAGAGRIASRAEVGRAKLIHISPRYEGREDLILREVVEAAGRGCPVEEGWKP